MYEFTKTILNDRDIGVKILKGFEGQLMSEKCPTCHRRYFELKGDKNG